MEFHELPAAAYIVDEGDEVEVRLIWPDAPLWVGELAIVDETGVLLAGVYDANTGVRPKDVFIPWHSVLYIARKYTEPSRQVSKN